MASIFIITGPESSGKTVLTEQLSKHFGVAHVPEFAREYLSKHRGEYNLEDLEIIAREQQMLIKKASKMSDLVIADTGPLVMKIWSEFKFGHCGQFIEDWWELSTHDYLLCRPDLEWEFDPLRENPNDRDELFSKYYLCLESSKNDFVVISGQHHRYDQAKRWIASKI